MPGGAAVSARARGVYVAAPAAAVDARHGQFWRRAYDSQGLLGLASIGWLGLVWFGSVVLC